MYARKKRWVPYVVFILISLAAGGLSAIFVMRGMPAYGQLAKPALTPPPIVFPIVWNLLYLLMGIGAARVWLKWRPGQRTALAVFGVQLALNFFWNVLFFGLELRLFAFLWLLLLIVFILMMILSFSNVEPTAGRLQIPYLLWTVFAAYLNCAIWLLNR